MNINRNRRRRLLAASLLVFALSASMCIGSTVAWFNDTLGSQSVLTIGSFNLNTSIAPTQQKSVTQLPIKGSVLPAGVYTLSLRGVGNTPGYGMIYLSATQSDFRKDVYSTPQMGAGSTFTCTLMLHEPTEVRVVSIWGITQEENPLKNESMVYYGRPPGIDKDVEAADTPTEETNGSEETVQATQDDKKIDNTLKANTTTETTSTDNSAHNTQVDNKVGNKLTADTTTKTTETNEADNSAQTTQVVNKVSDALKTDTTTKVTETSGTDSAVQNTQVANKVSDALKTDTTTKVTETSGTDNVVQNTQTDGTTQAVISGGETSTQTTDDADA